MPDTHVLTQPQQDKFRLVRHIVIASALNGASVNWRTALINSGVGGKTVLPDGDGTAGTITAAEKALITSGALYEFVEDVSMPAGLTQAQQLAYLDETYTRVAADQITFLQRLLQFYGATRDTPGQGQ